MIYKKKKKTRSIDFSLYLCCSIGFFLRCSYRCATRVLGSFFLDAFLSTRRGIAFYSPDHAGIVWSNPIAPKEISNSNPPSRSFGSLYCCNTIFSMCFSLCRH
ncbi:hypothetical protein EDEG_02023 [Edhazardia aedis USNM 41457]|uniref:Uncharacterized protein n=1 Tax=Edhazardia aedis (strain USNM 41457) TaxID=1003232 RepID=J9DQQ7_EDHAE|nr:hypothetical protein EDEG_02023 [Edhazardia aedis USNM 41457]|eukprot:EJW03652.1 hypothetical protein EDEG_02023 [Edhazardia aedis USNM 41457]